MPCCGLKRLGRLKGGDQIDVWTGFRAGGELKARNGSIQLRLGRERTLTRGRMKSWKSTLEPNWSEISLPG